MASAIPSINNPNNEYLTSDGSIEPLLNFLTTNPLDSAYKAGRSMVLAACKSNSHLQKICNHVESSFPETFQTKRALVLTANADHNGAFILGLNTNPHKRLVFQQLELAYDVKYKRISDITTFCNAIDEETKKNGPLELLIIRGHGSKTGLRLDTSTLFKVGDPLPTRSCLQNLPPHATIVIDSCSVGKGREYARNFANYIAAHSPPSTRIFSPTEDITGFVFSKVYPIEVNFEDLSHPLIGNITYKIDPENPLIMNMPSFGFYEERDDFDYGRYIDDYEGIYHSSTPSQISPRENEATELPNINLHVSNVYVPLDDLKNANMSVAMSIGQTSQIETLVPLTSPQNSSINVSTQIIQGTQVGVLINPRNMNASSISVMNDLGRGVNLGIGINPMNPKKVQAMGSMPIGSANMGCIVNPRTPMNSTVSISVPVYGVPVGISTPLNRLNRARFTIGYPGTPLQVSVPVGKIFKKAFRKLGFGCKHKHKHKHKHYPVHKPKVDEFYVQIKTLSASTTNLQSAIGNFREKVASLEISTAQRNLEVESFNTKSYGLATSITNLSHIIDRFNSNNSLEKVVEDVKLNNQNLQKIYRSLEPIVTEINQGPSLVEINKKLEENVRKNQQIITALKQNQSRIVQRLQEKISLKV